MNMYSGCVFFLFFFHLPVASSFDCLSLCPEEKRSPTVFADVGDNITLTICVIHRCGLTLDIVYCYDRCSCQSESDTCYLPKERFSSTLVPRDGGHNYIHNLTISVDRVQEDLFGILTLRFFTDQKRFYEYSYIDVQFTKKGIAFSSYNSDKRFIPGVADTDSELYLMCESRDYPPSSLSIVQKYSKEILDTSVVDGVVVYHIKSVQCSHMGTYVCFYNNDTSQNSTLDVFVIRPICLYPQLCYAEKKTRTVIAALYGNVSIELCVITRVMDSLVLDSVFRHDNSEDKLLKNRYESSLISTESTYQSHWKVNVTLRDIQENDFGQISIKLCDRWDCLTYEMILEKKRMELKIYRSEQLLPVDKLFYVGDSLHLICESGGYHPSSLSIGKLYNKSLHAPVFDRDVVHRIVSLQCSDMGTYVCFYKHDPSENATVNVLVKFCPPQLCHMESRNRTIYASLNDNVIVDICVIYRKIPVLTSVFRNGNETDKLLKSRYGDSSISPMASQGLYWKVNFVLRDLQEEDFGNISVTIGSMNVTVLVKNEIDFKIYKSAQPVPVDELFYSGESLHLICESGVYHPSSLSIGKFYSKEILHAPVFDGNLVYRFERLQCSDMGTYVCFYKDDPSKNVTVNVPVKFCPPQLCHMESRTRTIYASLNDNVTVDICVISLKSPSLTSVFRNGNTTDKLLKSRYEDSSILPMASQGLYWKVNLVLRDLQEEDFGNISVNIDYMNVTVFVKNDPPELCPKENLTRTITADLYTNISFTLCLIAHDELFVEKVYLDDRENNTVEENRYRLTSENTRQYEYAVSIELFDIQKEDFGNVTFRLKHRPVPDLWMDYEIYLQQTMGGKLNDPPELCQKENLTRTITADLYTNISFTLCLIAHDDLFVEKVYLRDRENNIVEENRYRLTSENTRQDVYAVSIEMFNIQKEDFGNVTFRLKHRPVLDLWIDYEIYLQQKLNVSEDSSLIIYVVLPCLTVVAMILVGICIYRKKGPKKSSSRTPAPYYVNELNDGQPTASQQLLRRSVPRDENGITDRQPALSQQMQGMIQDRRNGYLDVVPGPIYPEPCHIYEVVGPPTASKQLLRRSVPREENEIIDRQPASSQQMQATIQDGRDGYLDVVPGPIIYLEPGHETDGQPAASQQLLRHSVPRDENEITDRQPSSSQEMQATIQEENGYLDVVPGPIFIEPGHEIDGQPSSSQQMQAMIQDGENGHLETGPVYSETGPIYSESGPIYLELRDTYEKIVD